MTSRRHGFLLLRVISREAGAFRAAEPPDVHPGLRGDLEDELGKVLVLHGFGESFVDVGGGDLDGFFLEGEGGRACQVQELTVDLCSLFKLPVVPTRSCIFP